MVYHKIDRASGLCEVVSKKRQDWINGSSQNYPKRVQMCSMTTLSPKRAAILTFIRDRIAQNGQPPSLAEISEAFGFASRSVARKHIVALTEAGLIEVT